MLNHRRRAIAITVSTGMFLALFCAANVSPAAEKTHHPQSDALLKQVDAAIQISTRRYLRAGTHTPWQIMHGMLAYRHDYIVKDAKGNKINAVDWVSQGPKFHGESWFQKTRYGAQAHPYSLDYVFEGHANQFLAIMAGAGFPLDHKLKAGQATISVRDIVNNSKMEVNNQDELTWTLWALNHYLGPDAKWTNKYGQEWSIEGIVSIQNRENPANAACGGTHGLYALSTALHSYRKTGRPLRGVWLAADQRVKRYIAEAKAYQNADGSFSSEYFHGHGYNRDFEKRLSTSGHTLEFLMAALPDSRLQEDWVRKGVAAVAKDLIDNKSIPAEPGALYHAVDGLVLYRERVTGKGPKLVSEPRKTGGPVKARRPIPVKSHTVAKPVRDVIGENTIKPPKP